MGMKTEKVYIEYLVLQTQLGDSSALQKLLVLVQQKMLSYAKRIMHGSADAEDCVQDALLVVVKKLSQLKDTKAFHGWMYQVIHSRCQDHWRRNSVQQQSLDSINQQGVEFEVETNLASEQTMDIKQAMSGLSKTQQSVIYLFYFEGFKVSEVAVILKKPAGTIKSLLFDARAAIKSFLNQE